MDGIKNYLSDMDGVIVKGSTLIPGAAEFIHKLLAQEIPFLILTNNSRFIPRDLQVRLRYMGLNIPVESIFTSALATAQFLHDQQPGGRAFVIGESGLTTALHDIGYILTDQNPEYVILGETVTYSFEQISSAIRFILNGARFIATNPDMMGPGEGGIVPATGALAALISAATGKQPYFIGKPNPLMMRTALRRLNAHSEDSVMIGDRMDTDIISGLESGLRTVLVLTGVTSREQVERFPYRPTWIRDSIADIEI
ncbi:MAG TPA: HAD-IIA family hydrolase [Ktedonobacteraceae bacterium]|nr:HAD-IIA family hydrolase [Ktedonobacteraceae bacterium]